MDILQDMINKINNYKKLQKNAVNFQDVLLYIFGTTDVIAKLNR